MGPLQRKGFVVLQRRGFRLVLRGRRESFPKGPEVAVLCWHCLEQLLVGRGHLYINVSLVKGCRKSWDVPLLSPKRISPKAASASRPLARLVMCRPPLIFMNFAGDPSGSLNLSLTFWCDVVCSDPKQPATHSRSIIQSLT